jgi:hypothetical protein
MKINQFADLVVHRLKRVLIIIVLLALETRRNRPETVEQSSRECTRSPDQSIEAKDVSSAIGHCPSICCWSISQMEVLVDHSFLEIGERKTPSHRSLKIQAGMLRIGRTQTRAHWRDNSFSRRAKWFDSRFRIFSIVRAHSATKDATEE